MASDWVTDALITKTVLTGALDLASLAAVLLEHFPRLSPFTHKRLTHIPTYAQFTLVAVFLTAAYTIYNDWSSARKEYASEQTDQQRFNTNLNRLDSLTQRLSLMDEAQKLKAVADSQRFRENLLLLDSVSENLDSTSKDLSLNVWYAQEAVGATYDLLQRTRSSVSELGYAIDFASINAVLAYPNGSCSSDVTEVMKALGERYSMRFFDTDGRYHIILDHDQLERLRKDHYDTYLQFFNHYVHLTVYDRDFAKERFSYWFPGPADNVAIETRNDSTIYWFTFTAKLMMGEADRKHKPVIASFRNAGLYAELDFVEHIKQTCPQGMTPTFQIYFNSGYGLKLDHRNQEAMYFFDSLKQANHTERLWSIGENLDTLIHYFGTRPRTD